MKRKPQHKSAKGTKVQNAAQRVLLAAHLYDLKAQELGGIQLGQIDRNERRAQVRVDVALSNLREAVAVWRTARNG
jgi:hypothetical protein